MLPLQTLNQDYEMIQYPTKTYYLNTEQQQIIGVCDKLDAIRQAVYKILHTERYEYAIYSWNFGVELQDLFGQPVPFVHSELKRRISEALLQDDRITEVDNFQFTRGRGEVLVSFRVESAQESFSAEMSVNV